MTEMLPESFGPQTKLSQEIHATKYRGAGESFYDAMCRISATLADDEDHRKHIKDLLLQQKFLPGGRIQASIGSPKKTTANNCFLSGKIEDSMLSIMNMATKAALTMRMGGGIGYSFNNLRPKGANIVTLESPASGPISFMKIYDAVCATVKSAGSRRGAQMGVLNCNHPDIEEFIRAKQNTDQLTNFNISIGVYDDFMKAVFENKSYDLIFNDLVYKTVDAKALWEEIMRSTWDWAEPGVLFLDKINEYNNLWYCEDIHATNPCQPSFATVLTPAGIAQFKDIDIGSTIWSGTDWTTVVYKEKTGTKSVYRYTTTSGYFVGTSNHNIIQNEKKCPVDSATTIDWNIGPFQQYNLNPQDIMDGLVLGDGSKHKASNDLIYLIIGEKDIDYFTSEIAPLITKARPGIKKGAYEIQTTIRAMELPKTFLREVPPRFYFGTPEKKAGFLKGLYSANGSICGNRITLKQSSKKLIQQVQEMLSSLGIRSYYTTNKSHKTIFNNGEYIIKESYDLNITSNKDEFKQLINFLHKYKQDKLTPNSVLKYKTSKIITKEYLGEEDVFSITVDSPTHSYWTGGCLVANCGEVPLPPFGTCLLGSVNLVKYVTANKVFDWDTFIADIPAIVRALDNVIDRTIYPLKEYEREQKNKRRMGIGITGLANAGEALGYPYATEKFLEFTKRVMKTLRNECYLASIELAKEKGSFPLFDKDKFGESKFVKRLPKQIQEAIYEYGIHNSHLLSVAPTGTISLSADNVSSGIEPVFAHEYNRTILTEDGPIIEPVKDYGVNFFNVKGRTTDEISATEHLNVLTTVQYYVDQSCSKTINIGDNVSWEDFKEIYKKAWQNGAKGVTTFRANGKRMGILNKTENKPITSCLNGACEI